MQNSQAAEAEVDLKKRWTQMCASRMSQSKAYGAEQCLYLSNKAVLKEIFKRVFEDQDANSVCTSLTDDITPCVSGNR